MAGMRVDLKGLFANAASSIPKKSGLRDYYAFSLEEFYQHLAETVAGQHTLAELAEHYCIEPPSVLPVVGGE